MKIDLYYGLLGSGKTTLISRMLETAYIGERIAVVENEVGKINLDAVSFQNDDLIISRLTSGCICCTIQGDFTRAVEELEKREHPDHLVIEPTGAADIRLIRSACEKVQNASISRCIMVVKANRLKSLMKVVGEFYIEQLQAADMIWLNFADITPDEKLAEVKGLLHEINPDAQLIDTPPDRIGKDTFPEGRASAQAAAAVPVKGDGYTIRDLTEQRRAMIGTGKKKELCTWNYTFSAPLSETQLHCIGELLQEKESGEIWRAKGLLPMQDGSLRKLDLVFGDAFEEKWDDSDRLNDVRGVLVLIGPVIRTPYLQEHFQMIKNIRDNEITAG